MIVSIIVAKANNNAIGLNGELPWHLPSDMKHFQKSTAGHHVVMGRKTYQSLGKPLPGRTHIIVSRNPDFEVSKGHYVTHSVEEAIELGKTLAVNKLFILGGAEVYRLSLPIADEMIITEINTEPEADTFFPDFNRADWQVVGKEYVPKDEKNKFDHTFVTYHRKKHP